MVTRFDVEADCGARLGRPKVSYFGTRCIGRSVACHGKIRCSRFGDDHIVTIHTRAKSSATEGGVEAAGVGCLVAGAGSGKGDTRAIQGECHISISDIREGTHCHLRGIVG